MGENKKRRGWVRRLWNVLLVAAGLGLAVATVGVAAESVRAHPGAGALLSASLGADRLDVVALRWSGLVALLLAVLTVGSSKAP